MEIYPTSFYLMLISLPLQFTFSVEIVPICKDDIVCMPLALARSNGNMKFVNVTFSLQSFKNNLVALVDAPHFLVRLSCFSQVVLCERVGSSIHLLDPLTLQRAEVSAEVYWRSPFFAIGNTAHLIEYMVMDLELVRDQKGAPVTRGKV